MVPRLVRFLTARKWLLGPKGVPGFESFLLGFWELKCCFGLGFSFGITSYVYIGLGSLSGKNPRQNLDTDKVLLLNF